MKPLAFVIANIFPLIYVSVRMDNSLLFPWDTVNVIHILGIIVSLEPVARGNNATKLLTVTFMPGPWKPSTCY